MALTPSPSSFPTTSFVSTLLTKPAQRCIRLKTSCVLSHRRLSALIEHNRRRFLQVKGGEGGWNVGLGRGVLVAARERTLLALLQCEAGGMRAAAAMVVAFLRLQQDGRVYRDRAVNTL